VEGRFSKEEIGPKKTHGRPKLAVGFPKTHRCAMFAGEVCGGFDRKGRKPGDAGGKTPCSLNKGALAN